MSESTVNTISLEGTPFLAMPRFSAQSLQQDFCKLSEAMRHAYAQFVPNPFCPGNNTAAIASNLNTTAPSNTTFTTAPLAVAARVILETRADPDPSHLIPRSLVPQALAVAVLIYFGIGILTYVATILLKPRPLDANATFFPRARAVLRVWRCAYLVLLWPVTMLHLLLWLGVFQVWALRYTRTVALGSVMEGTRRVLDVTRPGPFEAFLAQHEQLAELQRAGMLRRLMFRTVRRPCPARHQTAPARVQGEPAGPVTSILKGLWTVPSPKETDLEAGGGMSRSLTDGATTSGAMAPGGSGFRSWENSFFLA